jgi:hypothetical protein
MEDNKRIFIPLEKIQDKLPNFEEKKEEYRLRHYLYYHVIKKKKTNQKIEFHKKDKKDDQE